ncbi:vacuolar protein sorting-associated protein 41 homolog [Stylonychia lemnae]|uniref:Vacuolar protein sorting-associated protein 41 homolog n=1 Tax=Stylonychia lemnae TaxID=5949 RepID=A0A077ZP87_STYLE|nr:vacuolar protein sorting-associated protein 41 homolog [Stylonychia lemnae]|eukprot:CDW71200.1 vacuolar protein sorting-associated protein 41 homolog [Stylonychia lemnae]
MMRTSLLAIGTNKGMIYQVNSQSGALVNKYQAHSKKITSIYLKETSAIISSSHDGIIKITSLCPEFDTMTLEIKELELSCYCLRALTFNASNIEFFIGTTQGKLFYFYNGWLQNTKEVIHNNQEEGPILCVTSYQDVVSWATPKNIRVIHYGKKQKICLIERPKNSHHFPDYIYESKVVKPTIFWKKENDASKVDLLYISWYNLIKLCRLKLKEDQKFQMEVLKSIDLDNIFICGVSLIKEFLVLFQFTLPRRDNLFEETLQLIEQQKEHIPPSEVLKFQNIYLEHLMKIKDYPKIGEYLVLFLSKIIQFIRIADNKERWEHWINRLMQKKILSYSIQIIPKEYPRLDLKIYTKIFEHLLEIKDYQNVQQALRTFPPYLINQYHLMEVIKRQIEHSKELSNNKDVLEILFLLYDLNRDYLTAFHIIVKMKDKKVFDFLKRTQLDFDLGKYLSKLLLIDSSMTVDFLFQKYGKQQQSQIVDQCVQIIKQMERQDKDKLLYLYLDEVFKKNSELSKLHHASQIELYCRFNPDKLMRFLSKTEEYIPLAAAEICKQYDLFKEHAYLLMKTGNEPEAIRVLIDKCHKVSEIIELSVRFNINVDNMWDQVLLKSLHKTDQINSLLHYVDQYSKPATILSLYDENVKVGQVRDSLIIAFRKMRLYKFLLRSALHICQKSKQELIMFQVDSGKRGYYDIDNECDQCKKSLLTQKILNECVEITQKKETQFLDLFQQFTNSLINSNSQELPPQQQQYNQEPHQNLLKAFMIFRCGHKYHKKCMVAKNNLDNEEQKESKLQLSKQPFDKKGSKKSASNLRSSNSSSNSMRRITGQNNSLYECIVCSKFNFLIN